MLSFSHQMPLRLLLWCVCVLSYTTFAMSVFTFDNENNWKNRKDVKHKR